MTVIDWLLDSAPGCSRSRRLTADEPAGRDGRWPLQNVHRGASSVEMDEGEGRPSHWNTLRARRVLEWAAQSPDRLEPR